MEASGGVASRHITDRNTDSAALDRAFGYPARTEHDLRERAAVLELLRTGRPTGLPRELDLRLRGAFAWS